MDAPKPEERNMNVAIAKDITARMAGDLFTLCLVILLPPLLLKNCVVTCSKHFGANAY